MARESLEERRAYAARMAEHEERNRGAMEAEERALAAAGRQSREIRIGRPVEAKQAPAAPENKQERATTANKAGDAPAFASDEACALAEKHSLTATAFSGVKPSGQSGYTVGDVRALIPVG
jgi:hypothetical protein